jgi:quercetin dioxygenase-like cupin family protein
MTMATRVSRPFRPVELKAGTLDFFRLREFAEELRTQDEYRRSGVSGVTLARDEHLTVVLVALRKGEKMREHRAPSGAAVLLLSGRASFVSGSDGSRTELEPSSLAVFAPEVSHAVEAVEDAVYLVIIGGRDRAA